MSSASVQWGEAGVLNLSGVLDYRTGPTLRKEGQVLIASEKAPALVLDCSAVEKSSSVGLSLLLAFMRDASASGKTVEVRAMPQDMREIAEVYGLAELLAGR
ncbi:STAS domain-containing protein [Pseudomonas sp. FFUP_PS_473]|uniref:STAS domain-containing protein n=1 Tax=Pseudomonas TaxID=286 RepID=UPI0008115F22|nr:MULTISPECIES: STAS domain-containing protein [Pseudomonas]PLP90924.1 STAS domain-containing protein [Pseudomonas sp. FFUP_PS_473]